MTLLIFLVIALYAVIPFYMWPILNIAEAPSVRRWINGSSVVILLSVVVIFTLFYTIDYSGWHGGGIIYIFGLLPSYLMVPAGLIVLMGTGALAKRKIYSVVGLLMFLPTLFILAMVLYLGIQFFFIA